MNEQRLCESIQRHEGYRPEPYRDSLGKWTVGHGTLLEDMRVPATTVGGVLDAITKRERHDVWFLKDVQTAISDAEQWLGFMFKELTSARQEVVVEMAYQLGINRLSGFVKFRGAIANEDWERARTEMLDSRWHSQTPARAETLADKFRAG